MASTKITITIQLPGEKPVEKEFLPEQTIKDIKASIAESSKLDVAIIAISGNTGEYKDDTLVKDIADKKVTVLYKGGKPKKCQCCKYGIMGLLGIGLLVGGIILIKKLKK